MSYAIIRNEKLTRVQAMGAYKHNERKTKNHSNKNIDSSKTELNYYLKKNELSYIKEFDKIKEKYDLKGQIRSNSNIMCEMVFTSDQKFFDKISYEESKRYFEESYKFICEYKNLGEQNIISAVVHMDEDTPHMHLLFIPVIHTTDKQGNKINKVCCRDFWKGKNSYRDLQNSYFKHISEKGFKLERGELVEVTNREHYSVQEYKKITNFENTKELLKSIKLELPETPDIKDFKKIMLNRDEKIKNEISDDIKLEIKNTICSATKIRQEETANISKEVECMIIIGGKNSSNTKKLYDISKENCENTLIIETKNELNIDEIKKFKKIGIMAGASTPNDSIEDVIELIKSNE
mgnify:CR=1 FL=1